MKYWIIVNLTRADYVAPKSWDQIIWPCSRPKYLHGTREGAEAELLRLRQTHGDEFVLFEAVAFAKRVGAVPGIPGQTAYVVEPVVD